METFFMDNAPAAIGPYCHAVKTGNLVFCSGQTPLDPETMKITGTTIEEQTRRVLTNITIVLNGHTPARSAIAVKQNPLDAMVEIECIAEIKD